MDNNAPDTSAHRMSEISRQEIELFRVYRDELQARLDAGGLLYIIEWWEEDDMVMDENAHMSFLFAEDEYDFVLHTPTCEALSTMLAKLEIDWKYRMKVDFDSNILYPPEYAGQPYYEKEQQPWWLRLFDWREHWTRRSDLPE